MADNKFDLKGFLNDPKVQADKAGAIKFLQSKGIIDAGGGVISKDISTPTTKVPNAFMQATKNLFTPTVGLATGIGKGIASSIGGLHKFGSAILDQTAGRAANILSGKGNVPTANAPLYSPETEQKLKPKGAYENIGYYGEKAAEFAIPSKGAVQAEKYIDLATEGLSKVSGALARILGKSAVEATSAGATTLLTTGNPEEAKKTAATAGVLRGGLATLGEALRGFGIPKKFAGVIFKDTKADTQKLWDSGYAQKLQKTNPALFKDYVTKGYIKTAENGSIIVNKPLAEKAILDGLSGSTTNMGEYVVGKLKDFEDNVQNVINTSKDKLDLGKNTDNLVSTLKTMGAHYNGVADNSISDQAINLAGKIEKDGFLEAKDGLAVRRLLDDARKFPASGVAPTSLSQQNFEYWSNLIRGKLNKVEGINNEGKKVMLGEIMSPYSTHMKYLQSLLAVAKKEGNAPLISQFESALAAASFLTGSGIAEGAVIAGRFLKDPRILMGSAKLMSKQPTVAGATARAVIGKAIFQ